VDGHGLPGDVEVVSFIKQLDGAGALGSASVERAEEEEGSPVATTRDVIDGTPSQVVRTTSAANTVVLRRRTSTTSEAGRPSLPDDT
jgi:hypothetical protein